MTFTNDVLLDEESLSELNKQPKLFPLLFKKYLIKTYQIKVLITAFTKCSIVQNRTKSYSIVLYCTVLYSIVPERHITKIAHFIFASVYN